MTIGIGAQSTSSDDCYALLRCVLVLQACLMRVIMPVYLKFLICIIESEPRTGRVFKPLGVKRAAGTVTRLVWICGVARVASLRVTSFDFVPDFFL